MSKTKFTPGPWKLVARRDYCDEFECWLHPINLHIHDKISDADAHLIAAAPDLFYVVGAFVSWLNDNDEISLMELGEDAKAALAKARGEG